LCPSDFFFFVCWTRYFRFLPFLNLLAFSFNTFFDTSAASFQICEPLSLPKDFFKKIDRKRLSPIEGQKTGQDWFFSLPNFCSIGTNMSAKLRMISIGCFETGLEQSQPNYGHERPCQVKLLMCPTRAKSMHWIFLLEGIASFHLEIK